MSADKQLYDLLKMLVSLEKQKKIIKNRLLDVADKFFENNDDDNDSGYYNFKQDYVELAFVGDFDLGFKSFQGCLKVLVIKK